MSRSTGWGTCTGHGGLKLQGSTFLNELNRLAKELDLEDIATWPDRKPPPVTLLLRPCHAPVTLLSRSCHADLRGPNEGWALPIYPHPPNLRLHVAPQASYL